MRNSDDIKKDIAKYKKLVKRQGDFTIYASKYIEDTEILLGPQETVLPGVTPTTRKKKATTKAADSKD
jgi:hypothetical protein